VYDQGGVAYALVEQAHAIFSRDVTFVSAHALEPLDVETSKMTNKTASAQLESFIAKYTPELAAQVRAILPKMRARLPGALELVYDNYNALAIGFGPTESSRDCIFSIAVYPRWASLFFFPGIGLPDPHKKLQGNGNQARHIVLTTPEILDDPAVKALMKEALKRASPPLDSAQKHRIVIKSISPKQRPRRPVSAVAKPAAKPRRKSKRRS
jgi:hypothetical protein